MADKGVVLLTGEADPITPTSGRHDGIGHIGVGTGQS